MSPLVILWFWLTGLSLTFGVAGLIFWIFWWPLRLFLYSLIPVHATYAWVGKLAIIILVGWIGGIGIPLMFLFGGFMILLAISASTQ